MADPKAIAALRTAVATHPDAIPLRLQLAALLAAASLHADSLEQYVEVLSRDPMNQVALKGAMTASTAVGDHAMAETYGQLIGLGPAAATHSQPVPETGPGGGDPTAPGAEGGDQADAESEPTDKGPSEQVWNGMFSGDQLPDEWEVIRPSERLEDVGGMEAVKQKIQTSFLGPISNPEMAKAYGKSMRGGLLLFGPPGCGKTFIARAIAGVMGAGFCSVGLADVMDMWFGESERKLHQIFLTARRRAPCVIFFDELDALGQKRSNLKNSPGRGIVNMLLSEMDGVEAQNEGVFVLGATNHPWDVDPALLRPGRFDRQAVVLPPDKAARRTILENHLKMRPTEGIDLEVLAAKTQGFSGADLSHVCETAVEKVLAQSMASGDMKPIVMKDLLEALTQVNPSTGSWFATARNYVMFANEGGVFDELAAYMKSARLL